MIERTQRYIAHLGASRARVMIPSVVAAEYLAGFRIEEDRAAQMANLERFFFVPPLDAPAATLAASLLDGTKSKEMIVDRSRQRLKADCFIVATAIVHGAHTIVTSVEECSPFRRIAGGKIEVIEVPSVPKQESFLMDDG